MPRQGLESVTGGKIETVVWAGSYCWGHRRDWLIEVVEEHGEG